MVSKQRNPTPARGAGLHELPGESGFKSLNRTYLNHYNTKELKLVHAAGVNNGRIGVMPF